MQKLDPKSQRNRPYKIGGGDFVGNFGYVLLTLSSCSIEEIRLRITHLKRNPKKFLRKIL